MGIKKMIHLSSLLLFILLLIPCSGRVLDDPDYNPEDYTDVNLFGASSQTQAEVACESNHYRIYKSIPRSPPARRPYNCSLSPHSSLLATCDRSIDETVTFNVTLADIVVYFVGVDARDPDVCQIYRVFSEEDYGVSPESEEEEKRDEWRNEMKLNHRRGSTTSYPPRPTIHSRINELEETKKRQMPDDVRLLPIDDSGDDYEMYDDSTADATAALIKDVVATVNVIDKKEAVKNKEKNVGIVIETKLSSSPSSSPFHSYSHITCSFVIGVYVSL